MQKPSGQPSMKWHQFLTRVGLWLGAAAHLLSGFSGVLGSSATTQGMAPTPGPDAVSGMGSPDFAVGLVFIGLGALAIKTRASLAEYRRMGPRLLVLYLIASLAAYLMQSMLTSLVQQSSYVSAINPVVIVAGVVGICLHVVYYNKRAHLFVN